MNALPDVLRHLDRLTDRFAGPDGPIAYMHIYAQFGGSDPDAPLTSPVAQDSGFEGVACVDDVARAAILALQTHEQTGSAPVPAPAKEWLGFLAYMQEPDGRFTNFIRDDTGRKNLAGATSYIGGDWWTARALWALATAWRVTGDPTYLARFRRTPMIPTSRFKVLGIQVLALLELYRCEPVRCLSHRSAADATP